MTDTYSADCVYTDSSTECELVDRPYRLNMHFYDTKIN